jgi:hypothetical protein
MIKTRSSKTNTSIGVNTQPCSHICYTRSFVIPLSVMKIILFPLSLVALLTFAGCNKNSDGPDPISNPNPYTNSYAGTYNGLYSESNNGVDTTGVFKIDTSYTYSLKIEDAGNHYISILHGPVTIPSIPVDSTGNFYFEDYNHNIYGYFTSDSLYITSDALNGYFDTITYTTSWFVIQKLSFAGKKEL